MSALALVAPSSAPAQFAAVPRESVWETNGRVLSVVPSDGVVYLGGTFNYVGPNTGHGVPIDASTGQFHPVFPKVNGTVLASAPDGAGGWFIGGEFTGVGGLTRRHIAHIRSDGTTNPNWNPDANGVVRSLVLSNDGSTLYIGGEFTALDKETRNRVAALDAATGALAAWNPNADDTVFALASSGSTVYAGGSFHSIGGQSRACLAALDAATGQATPWDPAPSRWQDSPYIQSLAISGSTVFAGGSFDRIGGEKRNNLAAIDGATAQAADWILDANRPIYALAVSGATLYIAGDFDSIGEQSRSKIAAFDLAADRLKDWNPNANKIVYGLAVSGSEVYAAGSFTRIGGQDRSFLAALDPATGEAAAWNPRAGAPARSLSISGSTLYVGGQFTSVGGLKRNRIAALDAATGIPTNWDPDTVGSEVAALAVAGSTVYVGGRFTEIGGQERNNIAALDAANGIATTWNPGANGRLHAMAISGTRLYVGGEFTNIGGQARNCLAALDTASGAALSWNPKPSGGYYLGQVKTSIDSLLVSDSTVYVGGRFTRIDGEDRTGIAALDATTGQVKPWNPVLTSMSVGIHPIYISPAVHAVEVSSATLHLAGFFDSVDYLPREALAALDVETGAPSAWNPGIAGTMNRVHALALQDSTLYIGGVFSSIGGQGRNFLAALDTETAVPTAWNPDPSGSVQALAVSGSALYVGGWFTSIANQARSGFAQFDAATEPSPPPAPEPSPTPVSTSTPMGFAFARETSISFATPPDPQWLSVSADAFDEPTFSYDDSTLGALRIAPNGGANVFGYWTSDAPVLTLEIGKIYFIQFTVRSTLAAPDDAVRLPSFRTRCNTSDFRHAVMAHIHPSGWNAPTLDTPVVYTLALVAGPELDGQGLLVSFDLMSFDDKADLGAALLLDQVDIFAAPLPVP